MSVKHLIDSEYIYRNMTDEDLDVLTLSRPLTVRISKSHLHMLQAMADMFKKSRAAFGAELIQAAISEAFEEFAPEDRRLLADIADEAAQGCKGPWNNQVLALEAKEAQFVEEVA